MSTPHTPTDSLQLIDASASLLDWIADEVTGVNCDEPDVDLAVDALMAYKALIRHEAIQHGRTGYYSTGHPVLVNRRHRQIEPDPNGGPDRITWVIRQHTGTPDGKVMGLNYDTA